MEPINFKESNKTLSKPDTMTDEECSPLTVYTNGKECISCWKMSWKERLSTLIFGKVWLSIHSGKTQPPVSLNACMSIFNE